MESEAKGLQSAARGRRPELPGRPEVQAPPSVGGGRLTQSVRGRPGDRMQAFVPQLTFTICKFCRDVKISQGMSVTRFELLE